ncbi:DUF1648 domain-containing protein [Lactiplantibacillus paraplantarum]|uniref:DUF1648 domain-containing protein n=1 Tax=Lactiplantibacillus paraplantarum TaxID=60520 RepID=UPI0005135388|nr:DUF1648 domain-containing protein [Lactiplantibacillus paraplantarum]OAX75130.1 hypothetical protein A0U96_01670 [Lactiplantibacillus plantarum]ALO04671.1 hypothetical protein ASU28_10100 [Lactiplantibacillus paraplantarum]KGE74077.1 membrane protein [Lactiplantibacillus paraplantarum]MCT4456573.1 DUF1648 domain-containing protein [Lactiplantibacillus paraplantarum]MCW1910730.1 DUF1648 domain-containing protein [Lactiplantibacillus paraplantarum]
MMKRNLQLWLSYIVILLPMGYGIVNYTALPAKMAIHFNLDNQPNGMAAKSLVVFGFPVMMMVFQLICVGVTRLNANHKGPAPRFERMIIWIVPVLSGVIYTTTISYGLGHQLDIWRIAISLIAFIFMAIGNYLPTISANQYAQLHRGGQAIRPMIWRRVRYWLGYTLVGGGILLLLSIATTPWISVSLMGIIVAALFITSLYGTLVHS